VPWVVKSHGVYAAFRRPVRARVRSGEEILLECDYSTDLFDRPTIERLLSHYESLLTTMVQTPSVPISCGPSSAFQRTGSYVNGRFSEKNLSRQVDLAPYAWVRVEDTGQGMPEEVLSKIFYPFFTTKEKGSGIGLAIAQKIIDSHHGSIDVESEVGNGTTFTIKLPF